MLLKGESGEVWAAAFLSSDQTTKPIYVSTGHRIEISVAVKLTARVTRFRVPEPVRRADLGSREVTNRNRVDSIQ